MPETETTLFRTPFSPAYWRCATRELKSPRVLATAALFIAIRIVMSAFFVPIGENLRIYFGFFVNALGSLLYGPVVSLMVGFIHDILEFTLHPTGAFFPGYTLTAMLGAFFYAIFLYRARVSVVRITLCKIAVNGLVNVLLGSVWSAVLYGKGYYYYLAKSLIKNVTLLPFEILLLVLFLQLMLPLVARMGLAPPQPTKRIPLL